MALIPNWKKTLKKAWSVRFMVAAALLTATEAAMPFFDDVLAPRPFAIATFAVVGLAMLARFFVQKDLKDD